MAELEKAVASGWLRQALLESDAEEIREQAQGMIQAAFWKNPPDMGSLRRDLGRMERIFPAGTPPIPLLEALVKGYTSSLLGPRAKSGTLPKGFWSILESLPGEFLVRSPETPERILRFLKNLFFRDSGIAEKLCLSELPKMDWVHKPRDLRLSLGLLAWKAGFAALREALISQAQEMSPSMIQGIFGSQETRSGQEILEPFADGMPGGQILLGGHRLFGGPWERNPDLVAVGNHVAVLGDERFYRIHIDRFGHQLVPFTTQEDWLPLPGRPDSPVKLSSQGPFLWVRPDSYYVFSSLQSLEDPG